MEKVVKQKGNNKEEQNNKVLVVTEKIDSNGIQISNSEIVKENIAPVVDML